MNTEDYSVGKSTREAKKFYSGLERRLKRYDPKHFGSVISRTIWDVLENPAKQKYYPFHLLIHSIEANCAYHRPYRNVPLTQRKIDNIFNIYKDYYDPYLRYKINVEKNIQLFVFAMDGNKGLFN